MDYAGSNPDRTKYTKKQADNLWLSALNGRSDSIRLPRFACSRCNDFMSLLLRKRWTVQVRILTEYNIQKSKQITYGYLLSMVGVTGFEPAASCSQSKRATNCATPRCYLILYCFILFGFYLTVRCASLRNIVALLACSASHCSVFLHLRRTPSSATGSGVLLAQLRYKPKNIKII